jgi:hypothetical protein
MKRILIAATAAALGLATLTACETPTPYQPLKPGATSGGYSEVKIEGDRWRVTFSGNSMTKREVVETYLLYRAAELTVNQGFDWFETVERHTTKHAQTYAWPAGPYGYGWAPYWRWHRAGWGWRGWDPYWGDPFWADGVDVETVREFQAWSEIVMHKGPKPQGNVRAFDARDVMSNLAGKIAKPG